MRVALALLTLVLTVSACAIQPPPTSGPVRDGRPLRAYISPVGLSDFGFYVNRPAHVAVFEIVPGRGSSLVYPSPGMGRMDGFVFGGAHQLGWGRRYNAQHYLPASYGLSAGPRFFFMVASEEPLDLDPIGAFGMGLHGSMGMHFASLNAYSSMERLASTVLPSTVDDGSWTTDLYVYWPNVLYDSQTGRRDLVQVRCNGYTMLVPVEQIPAVRATLCDALNGREPQPAPGDSTGGDEILPKRRQPLPKAQAEELRERIASSTQLRGGEARGAEPRAGSREVNLRERSGGLRAAGDEPRAVPGSRSGRASRGEDWRGTDVIRRARGSSSRGSSGGRAEPRAGSAEPRSRPSAGSGDRAEPRAPAARPAPTPRSGGTERVTPRERPTCNPCEQP